MDYHYKLIETAMGPRYVLHEGDEPIGEPLVEVAVCFDKESGVMHKHGKPEYVSNWYNKSRQKLMDAGFPDMAAELTVVCGPIPVDELNKILSISGYCGRYFSKLQV